jgi:alkylation response protein AidB-like acyl-CoA dehydrogenase
VEFGFNDTQQEIRDTARSFLADRFRPEKVRELAEAEEAERYDDALWAEVCELGWPGIAIAEQHGGQGLGMVELAILCEQIGYACAPMPFLSSAAAALAIAAAGDDGLRDELLPGLASGERRGSIGARDGGGGAPLVPDAGEAEAIVLFDGEGAEVLAAADADVEPLKLIDLTRRWYRVGGADGRPLEGDVAAARDRVAVAIAAELVGIAQRAMDMSVDYAKERHQFGRPIGAYQAVSHSCARMLYDVEEARSLVLYAAWAADAEPGSLPLAAAMAKARASDAAWDVTRSAIQVHGGIGFTWEHDLHLLLKRARAVGLLLGTSAEHRDRVATLAGLE